MKVDASGMGRTLPILGIIGAALAAITATILVEPAPVIVGLYAIGAGVVLALQRDWRRMAPGAVAILFGILGTLGVLQYIGGEANGFEVPISAAVGQALIAAGALSLAGAAILLTWRKFQPEWISYVWAAFWGLGVILALVYRADLGDQTQAGSFLVAMLCLATLGAPIMQLRNAA